MKTTDTTTLTAAQKRVNLKEIKDHLKIIKKAKAELLRELAVIHRTHKELDRKAVTLCRSHDRDAAAHTRRIRILSGRI